MFDELSAWLDQVLEQEIPDGVVAFGFNLYDDGDDNWALDVVGTPVFDPEDPDWACEELTTFDTRDNPFSWESEQTAEEVEEEVLTLLKDYLASGAGAEILKSRQGVGCGFVDGDLTILFNRNAEE